MWKRLQWLPSIVHCVIMVHVGTTCTLTIYQWSMVLPVSCSAFAMLDSLHVQLCAFCFHAALLLTWTYWSLEISPCSLVPRLSLLPYYKLMVDLSHRQIIARKEGEPGNNFSYIDTQSYLYSTDIPCYSTTLLLFTSMIGITLWSKLAYTKSHLLETKQQRESANYTVPFH